MYKGDISSAEDAPALLFDYAAMFDGDKKYYPKIWWLRYLGVPLANRSGMHYADRLLRDGYSVLILVPRGILREWLLKKLLDRYEWSVGLAYYTDTEEYLRYVRGESTKWVFHTFPQLPYVGCRMTGKSRWFYGWAQFWEEYQRDGV